MSVSYLEDNYKNPNLLSISNAISIMSNTYTPPALKKL